MDGLLDQLNFPVARLAPAEVTEPIRVRLDLVDRTPYVGVDAVRDVISGAADAAWERAIQAGRTVFNRPGDEPGLVRCVDIRDHQGQLQIDLQPTWFWTHLGTNVQIRAGQWDGHPEMVAAESRDIADLAASCLANVLAVDLTILSADEPPKVLMQRRGSVTASTIIPYQCSAAGFVDLADVTSSEPEAAATKAALREAVEETALDLSGSSVSWLALGRDTWAYGLGLAGYCRIESASEGLTLFAAPADQFEVDGYEWWDFTPQGLMRHWKELGYWWTVVPLGGFSLITTLAYLYGEEAVAAAFEEVGRIPLFPP